MGTNSRNDGDSSSSGSGSSGGRRRAARGLPLLPLRDIIVFPYMVVPLFVGREKSIHALDYAMAHNREIVLCAQKKARTNDPSQEDIFTTGTLAEVLQLLRLPDGTVKVLVEGKRRTRIRRFLSHDEHLQVEIEEFPEPSEDPTVGLAEEPRREDADQDGSRDRLVEARAWENGQHAPPGKIARRAPFSRVFWRRDRPCASSGEALRDLDHEGEHARHAGVGIAEIAEAVLRDGARLLRADVQTT